MKVAVIYIHFGKLPDYLLASLSQAASYNREVILITDSQLNLPNISTFDTSDFQKGVSEFESVYKHMSSNTPAFEMICIKRWFILRNFMNEKKMDVCYYTDSDVMIYDDLSKAYENFKEFDAAYTLAETQDNYQWAASACCSYWQQEAINRFCDFVMECYSDKNSKLDEKWKFHQQNNVAGGICDMTLLYLFTSKINFFSLTKVVNDSCFDQNILIAENYKKDEYRMIKRRAENRMQKEVTWKKGIPFGYNRILEKEVRFITLTEYAKLICDQKSIPSRIERKIRSLVRKLIRK
ncbi:MAG: hypothetical protein M3R27_06725 [Bacteroidota bacterium]|nr:hypothetical protein [Bacteroidota bacterium]